jgi:hypothetical protein
MFQTLLAHPQETLHKRHLVYCVLKLVYIKRYLCTLPLKHKISYQNIKYLPVKFFYIIRFGSNIE